MRGLLRLLGVTVTAFFIIVFATFTFQFIKKAWFGKGGGSGKPHVAVLTLTGMMLSSTDLIKELEEELESSNTKAIVLRINSPGGLVAPSQEIYEALRRADTKKPVLVSMGPLAASGGYYAALGGRKIYANSGTLTASIGVIMEFVNMQKLYEWAKMDRYTITAGKMKGAGSPFRPMRPDERKLFEVMLADIHSQFRATVKERRKISDEAIEEYADGRVMTGGQAYEAKLVDALGSLQDTLREAKKIAGLPEDSKEVYVDKKSSFFKQIFFGDELEGNLGDWLKVLTGDIPSPFASPGWRVMLLAPVR